MNILPKRRREDDEYDDERRITKRYHYPSSRDLQSTFDTYDLPTASIIDSFLGPIESIPVKMLNRTTYTEHKKPITHIRINEPSTLSRMVRHLSRHQYKHCHTLEIHFDMRQAPNSIVHLTQLLHTLFPRLEKLDLENTCFGTVGKYYKGVEEDLISNLMEALSGLLHLKTLCLNNCRLHGSPMQMLSEYNLPSLPELRELYLRKNRLDSSDINLLVHNEQTDSIYDLSSLRILDLSDNKLDHISIRNLSETMIDTERGDSSRSKILKLCLSNNPSLFSNHDDVGEDDDVLSPSLFDCLSRFHSLLSLELKNTGMNDRDCLKLSQCISSFYQLRTLDVSNNPITTEQSVRYLLDALKKKKRSMPVKIKLTFNDRQYLI